MPNGERNATMGFCEMKKMSIFAGVLLLAACQPAAEETVMTETAAIAPVDTVFEERQPDLCHAVDYVPYLSQPGSVVPTLGIDRRYRVVEWRGIETQEYDAQRITFRLDAAGNIYNIDCG